ncbi:MAG: type I restriction endonuclease subunit R, partial [Prevotella sp.]|nr:type I restriction endonuclease subunit R [Prevotella sp.]
MSIKHTFPRALLFGFTGTPVFEENAHNEITTGTIFGDMLHKYTIANGIPDGNVLGFDPYRVNTYDDDELREKAAFARLKVHSIEEIEDDEEAMKVYDQFMHEMPMVDTYSENGETKHGVEHYLPKQLYQQDIHHQAVAADIMSKFDRLSKNRKFHAILATKNIPEAIAYYELFKSQYSSMNVVAVFDNNIDNSDEGIAREDAILEMLEDYNAKYQTSFGLPNYAQYKKDVAKRLAHKKPYKDIEHDHTKQIDLLIVVTQMLTGYDSKWVNTLYVDKVMKYVDVIQSFSRTNRLFGPDKPFGTIYYYTFPYTMEQNINDALEVYVDRPLGVFVDKLEDNLMNINRKFLHIRDIFYSHELFNFERLPDTREDRNMFAKDFSSMTRLIEAAKLQGFVWEQLEYEFRHDDTFTHVKMELDENTYLILLQRYRELFEKGEGGDGGEDDFDYPVDTFITETGTGAIDAEYINSKFVRFIKKLYTDGPGSEPTKEALRELHKTFASLPQKDQRTAILILHDIQCGDLRPEAGKTIQDYINEYQLKELHKQAVLFAEATGVNISMLEALILANPTEENLDDFSRFSELRLTLDTAKTRTFIAKVEGEEPKPRMVISKGAKHLKAFVLDADMRERILTAYLNDDITLDTAVVEQTSVEEGFKELENPTQEQTGQSMTNLDRIKVEVEGIMNVTMASVKNNMRPMKQIVNSVFYVIDAESIPSLDGVGLYLRSAFDNLYKEGSTIIDKFVAFNLLCTKFEAYLKKLYYLMYGEEVPPREPGQDVTWSNVI